MERMRDVEVVVLLKRETRDGPRQAQLCLGDDALTRASLRTRQRQVRQTTNLT